MDFVQLAESENMLIRDSTSVGVGRGLSNVIILNHTAHKI